MNKNALIGAVVNLDSGATTTTLQGPELIRGRRSHSGHVVSFSGSRSNIKSAGNMKLGRRQVPVIEVPASSGNFLSVGDTTKHSTVVFNRETATIYDNEDYTVEVKKKRGGVAPPIQAPRGSDNLYRFKTNAISTSSSFLMIHYRWGHVNFAAMIAYRRRAEAAGKKFDLWTPADERNHSGFICRTCAMCKSTRVTRRTRGVRRKYTKVDAHVGKRPFEVVGIDICKVSHDNVDGYIGYIIFIDGATGWPHVELIKNETSGTLAKAIDRYHKAISRTFTDVPENMVIRRVAAQRDDGIKDRIRILEMRSDKQFHCRAVQEYLEKWGSKLRTSIASYSSQNGLAERGIRALNDIARCLIVATEFPIERWPLALQHAVHLRRFVPRTNSKSIGLCLGLPFNLTGLRVFGCRVYVHTSEDSHASQIDHRRLGDKYAAKAFEGFYAGVPVNEDGTHRNICRDGHLIVRKSDNRIVERRDIKFDERAEIDPVRVKQETPSGIQYRYVDEHSPEFLKFPTAGDRIWVMLERYDRFYAGKVIIASEKKNEITVLFEDGDEIILTNFSLNTRYSFAQPGFNGADRGSAVQTSDDVEDVKVSADRGSEADTSDDVEDVKVSTDRGSEADTSDDVEDVKVSADRGSEADTSDDVEDVNVSADRGSDAETSDGVEDVNVSADRGSATRTRSDDVEDVDLDTTTRRQIYNKQRDTASGEADTDDEAAPATKRDGNITEVVTEDRESDIASGVYRRTRGASKVHSPIAGRTRGAMQLNAIVHRQLRIAAAISEKTTPSSLADALSGPYAKEWRVAIDDEMRQLEEKGVYRLVNKPAGQKVIKSRLIIKLKTNADGTFDKRKARLVAKGFSQIPGKDFSIDEVFAPVIGLVALRTILAIAAIMDLQLHVVDVKGAYLNSNLKERIFMEPPKGHHLHRSGKVMRLFKALYGLKQSAHLWNSELNKFLLTVGFKRIQSDPCVYVKALDDGCVILVGVFVDDIPIAASNIELIEWFKKKITEKFRINDLGEARSLLGIQIVRDRKRKTIKLMQPGYIDSMAERFEVSERKAHTPSVGVDRLHKLDELSEKPCHRQLYMELVGSLLYATMSTRFDIRHRVRELCKYMSRPSIAHLAAAMRVLQYLHSHKHLGLVYRGGGSRIELYSYCDAAHICDPDSGKSVSGFVVYLGRCPIACESRRQSLVTLSTMESEYCAILPLTKMLRFLRNLLEEIGFKQTRPTVIREDNEAVLKSSKSRRMTKRNRHVDLRFHATKDLVERGVIELQYVRTDKQVADVMTKNHTRFKFEELRAWLLGVKCSYLPCE